MTLVRERRHQQALRLYVPPPFPARVAGNIWHHQPASQVVRASQVVNDLSDLEKLEVVGHGSSGSVYKVQHQQSGSIYALKVLRSDYGSMVNPTHEAEILTNVNSEYLVRCHGIIHNAGMLCFIMEYMDYGSLRRMLQAHKRLPEAVISVVARRVLEGLKYLQGMQIVHRDIKPSNLLINIKGEVKIADFGLSTKVTVDRSDSSLSETNQGTWAYMSPERFDPENLGVDSADGGGLRGFAGDVWSLGMLSLECFLGQFPYTGCSQRPDWTTLTCAICFGGKVELPETMSVEFQSFLRRCLEKDWRKRGAVPELLDHSFVNKGRSDSNVEMLRYLLKH